MSEADPLDSEGPAAPPRANGELVFTAPWQSRIFAATMRLHEQDRFEWDDFRDRLIANIADHEKDLRDTGRGDDEFDYWSCWLTAFESLVSGLGLLTDAELTSTATALAARPAGHDHGHHHGHDHSH